MKKKKNSPIYTLVTLIILAIFTYFYKAEDSTVYKEDIPINEEVSVYTYGKDANLVIQQSTKKDINKASYVDIVESGISVNKASEVIDLINLYGSISQLEILKNIPRFTKNDLDRIRKNFAIDTNSLFVKKSDINKITEKQMIYLGIKPNERQKLLEYRKNNRIWNKDDLSNILSEKTVQQIEKYIKY